MRVYMVSPLIPRYARRQQDDCREQPVENNLLLWEDADDDKQMLALGRTCREQLSPFSSGATYLNFLGDEGEDRIRAGFGTESYERLAKIKARWDPRNVFRGNQSLAT